MIKETMPRIATLEDIITILRSPIKKSVLHYDKIKKRLFNESEVFEVLDGCPVLFPDMILDYFKEGQFEVPFSASTNENLQYFLLSAIKQNQESVNLPHDDYWYEMHLSYSKRLFNACNDGLLLDIGCDTPSKSISSHSKNIEYVGLDATGKLTGEFKVLGISEMLPFCDGCFDNVVINTVLDHVLDYHQAINEAARVLKPRGKLLLGSLIWTGESANLFRDVNHFHHFREGQILDALRDAFSIRYFFKENWKNNTHREALYLCAERV